MIIEGTNEEFEKLTSEGLVLVDFFATWCGPCKMLAPVLESVSKDTNINIIKVDVDKEEMLARKFGIMSVPTLIMFKDGEILSKQTGLTTKDILVKWIEENR
jgi:thioredoxin 1